MKFFGLFIVFGILFSSTVNATLECRSLFTNYDANIQKAVEKLRKSEKEALEIAALFNKSKFAEENNIIGGVSKLAVYRQVESFYFKSIQEKATTYQELLKYLVDHSSKNKQLFNQMLESLDFFINEAIHKYYEKRPPIETENISQIYSRFNKLIESWAELMGGPPQHGQVKYKPIILKEIIVALREKEPQLLLSPIIQSRLKEIVAEGLEHLVVEEILNQMPGSTTLTVPSNLYHQIKVVLQGWRGVWTEWDEKNSDVTIPIRRELFLQLVQEISINASQATMRRLNKENKELNFVERLPVIKVKDEGAKIRISIVDKGNPDEYEMFSEVGQGLSTGDRKSQGIGRFRIQVISKYLGYEIQYNKLPNNSGSAVDIIMPK